MEVSGGRLFLKALKYTPVFEHVDLIEWIRANDDCKPIARELQVEQGGGLESAENLSPGVQAAPRG